MASNVGWYHGGSLKRSQHHNVGIQPTVPLEPTIEGVRANRDELLEKALEIIKAQPIP